MKQCTAKVVSNIHILPECRRTDRRVSLEARLIWLNCPDIATKSAPGQFVMVRCGSKCVLPRPFSIFRAYGGDLAILYSVWEDGLGTEWLAGLHTNDEVQIFGPLGNGYTVTQSSKNLLLIAGGMGIAPIYYLLQQAISRSLSVTLLYGTESRNHYPIPPNVKHIQATEDGSMGHKGTVNDLIEQNIDKADQVFICGPLAMYSDMVKRKSELRLEGKSIQASLEVRMGCGTGVCYGCTIKTINGLKQVCNDGPVFNFHEVIWQSLLT